MVSRELVSISSGRLVNSRFRQLTNDVVVADSTEPNLGLDSERRVAHEHDVAIGCQHVAAPLREPTLEPHVHRAAEMPGCEVGRFPGVEKHSSRVTEAKDVFDVERRRRVSVEQRTHFAVALHLEGEVLRLG
jgi:hypothetical protein